MSRPSPRVVAATAAMRAFDALFGLWALRLQRKRKAGAIALYHRVAPEFEAAYPPLSPAQFERHCALLQRWFEVLPLQELAARQKSGKSLAGCCAVTFDDGYHDFLDFAYPILERHKIPATHFLVTDCLQSGRPNWGWRINHVFAHLANAEESLRDELKTQTANGAKEWFGTMPRDERYARLAAWEARSQLPSEPAMLSIEELKFFDANLIEWGTHTVSHATLGSCDAATIRHEIEDSQKLLREMTNREIRAVSYPKGSYSPQVVEIAAQSTLSCGVAVEQREVTARDNVFALPRFDIATTSRGPLRLEISGAMNRLRHAIRRQ